MGEPGEALWIFGYGSLMWRPGFEVAERARASLVGHHRAFCVFSTHHRGTAARPGLVLGLDRGGSCEGVAFRVAPGHERATIAYLREREQVTGVYREAHVPVDLHGGEGRHVRAVTYLVERAHPQYTGVLGLDAQARYIRQARGISGANVDYLANTVAHLRSLAIRDDTLERLVRLIGERFVRQRRESGITPGAAVLMATARPQRGPVSRLTLAVRRRFLYRRNIGVAILRD